MYVCLASQSAVSIHARTRRATDAGTTFCLLAGCFNPRPHTAGDTQAGLEIQHWRSFNPRPHTAGDTAPLTKIIAIFSFNPRPHTAGDGLSGR